MHPRTYTHLFLGLVLALSIGLAQPAQAMCVSDNDCAANEFCEFAAGTCPEPSSGTQGTCAAKPDSCTKQYDPVCGCDGKTYGNDCTRQQAGVSLKATGACAGDDAADSSQPNNLACFLQTLN